MLADYPPAGPNECDVVQITDLIENSIRLQCCNGVKTWMPRDKRGHD